VLGIFGVVKYQDNAFNGDDIEFRRKSQIRLPLPWRMPVLCGEIRELKDKLSAEKLYLEDEIRSE